MGDEHARFEELAVGHVLGGLPAADAAAFRDHLGGCRTCRSRVAELRGIADDLAAAERDERARAVVRTEVPRRADEEEPDTGLATGRIGLRQVTFAVVIVALLATAMGFWNLHLRTASATYYTAAEARGETLKTLAEGTPTEVETAGPVTAYAALDGDTIAVTIGGLAPLDGETWLVAWFQEADGQRALRLAAPGGLDDGAVSFRDVVGSATEIVVTREPQQGSAVPSAPPVVRIPLGGG